MSKEDLKPVHPGEVLLDEFLLPMHLSQNRLVLDIGVPPRRCAWAAISACRRNSGWAFRWIMIWMSPRMR